MSILLGNLEISEIESRLDVSFPDKLKEIMIKTKQESADTSKLGTNMWHCFDIPFVLVCGSMNFAKRIYKYLEPLSAKMETSLQISIREKVK